MRQVTGDDDDDGFELWLGVWGRDLEGVRVLMRDCGFTGEVCHVGGAVEVVSLVVFLVVGEGGSGVGADGGRKAARGLRMEVKISVVRSMVRVVSCGRRRLWCGVGC
jgi:hypothetical protein